MCSTLLRRVRCLTCAALVLLCSAAVGRAQYAGCANEIPAGYAVVDELRHDNGAGVTDYLSAGAAGGQQRTIVHANRYFNGGPGLITHICFNAQQPDDRYGAPPQQPVRLYIAKSDETRFGDMRPGSAVWNRTVGINGGWQLEEVNPPVSASGITWICAEFPTAIPTNGHMGVGVATVQVTTQSYVAILNFVGGQDLWVDYEGVQAQGWGYYNGKRPILRGLNLDDVSGGSCDPIVVGPPGNQTSESGGFVEFSVALSRVPAQNENVVVALSVSDPTEADVTPASLIFNSANWGLPQTVRVTGLDDLVADGDVAYSVGGICYSQDPCFHLRNLPTIGLVNRDDDPTLLCPPGVPTWQQLLTPALGGLRFAALAAAPPGNQLILFGGHAQFGVTNETYLLDPIAPAWVAAPPGLRPPARENHALASLATTSEVVLFGGRDAGGQPLGDTWLFDANQSWRLFTGLGRPPAAREFHALTSEGAGQILLYGGTNGSTIFGDTWRFDGAAWRRQLTPASPGPREGHALAYDPRRGRAVLFGGFDGVQLQNDTWEWDTATSAWFQVPTLVAPPPLRDARMVFDDANLRVVLVGGTDGASRFGETWAYDPNGAIPRWRPLDTLPVGRAGQALAYDPAGDRVVAYGGLGNQSGLLDDTWTFGLTTLRREFALRGVASGNPWSWSIRGLGWETANLAAPGVAAGSTADAIATAFAASINAAGCGAVRAVAPGGALLSIEVDDPHGFALFVGPAGSPTCPVLPGRSCTFNPEIVELVRTGADCNGNGADDGLDIATGYSADANQNFIPDECDIIRADCNCDGVVNNFDIDAFVLALSDPAAYSAVYPGCPRETADCDRNGVVNNFDIDPFVQCVANGGC